MLQQSMLTKGDNKSAWGEGSVLREVIDKALSRQKIEQEIKGKSDLHQLRGENAD